MSRGVGIFSTCGKCGQGFDFRNALILHLADVHGCDSKEIAVLMDYAPQSIGPKMIAARRAKKAGRI